MAAVAMDRRLTNAGVLLWAAIVALILVSFWPTFRQMSTKWFEDAAHTHCVLILPICLYLAWSQRKRLASVTWRPDWVGVIAVLACTSAWMVARMSGIAVAEQFAATALVPATALAVVGRSFVAAFAMPLGFLLFAVPVGKELEAFMMSTTADIAAFLLNLVNVPVYRTGMLLKIPQGTFEVARICSGIRYLTVGVTLGVLYAYLMYSSWRKRLLFVVLSLVVPVLANGLRVFLIVAIAYLTDMRWGTGPEHTTFGRWMFVVIFLAMFWFGARFKDLPKGLHAPGLSATAPVHWFRWLAVPAAAGLILATPFRSEQVRADVNWQLLSGEDQIHLGDGVPGWSIVSEATTWRPAFSGAQVEQTATFLSGEDHVEVYVGVFGLGITAGTEMISYENRIQPDSKARLLPETRRTILLADGTSADVLETIGGESDERLIWYWYQVGDRRLTHPVHVKAAEALTFVLGGASDARVVALSTAAPDDEVARSILLRFLDAHGSCGVHGFMPKACSR